MKHTHMQSELLGPLKEAPQEYKSLNEMQQAWSPLEKTWKNIARFLVKHPLVGDVYNKENDVVFEEYSVDRGLWNIFPDKVQPPKHFARGWTIYKDIIKDTPAFDENFKIIDGETRIPDTVRERRLIVNDREELLCVASRVVPRQDRNPFGPLVYPC